MRARIKGQQADKSKNQQIQSTSKPGYTKNGKKIGRKLLELDTSQIETLAAIGCSLEEIAAVVHCSVDTLSNRFSEIITRGRANGRTSLKRAMYKSAITNGNVQMQIWLSKQKVGMYCSLGLGYSEPREIQVMQPNEACMVATKAVDGTMIVFKPGTDPIEEMESASSTGVPASGSADTTGGK
jgi:hypothetical protein